MADAKIEIKIGEVSFVGEGTENWLTAQLEAMIKHLPELVKVAPPAPAGGEAHPHTPKPGGTAGTLATFLGANNRKKSQARKFLATAVWLHTSTGKDRLATRDVSDALSKNNQGKLANPAQCLNDNVGQGYCEKDGGRFYVTDEGKTTIG